MHRLAQHLLLLVTLGALAFTARAMTQLPWTTLAALLAAGVVAQGFASWKPAPPAVYGLNQPSRTSQALVWVVRAAVGSAVLCAMLAGGLWSLGALDVTPDWGTAVAHAGQWLRGFL